MDLSFLHVTELFMNIKMLSFEFNKIEEMCKTVEEDALINNMKWGIRKVPDSPNKMLTIIFSEAALH